MAANGSRATTKPSEQADDTTEIEWQFDALDLRPVERWLAALPAERSEPDHPTVTASAKTVRRHVDRYLDTDDWRIGRSGLVLRTRRRGRNEEATLKDNSQAGASGLRHRLEITEQLVGSGTSGLSDDGPVGRRVRAVAGRRPLIQVLEVRTRRRPYSLRIAGEDVAEIALDETVIDVGPKERPVQLRRVEVEVEAAWVDRLTPLVENLRLSCGLQPATLSKFEAGLLAIGASVPAPPDLGPIDVGPASSIGEVSLAVIRRHLAVLLAREPGTRLGEDIEELHDMRVATRRLRAALDLFSAVLPVRAQTLRTELSWLASVLGAVRDLDVQLDRMDEMTELTRGWSMVADDPSEDDPLVHLRQLLVAQRAEAREAMLEALDSPRWTRLAANLTTMVRPTTTRRSAASRAPAVAVLPDLIDGRHRSTVKAARRAKRSGEASDYHRLRIRAKRLRYALEFTVGIYGGRAERFTRKLAKLQDKLGLMQDAEVATTRLLALATTGTALPPITVFTMGGVAERYRLEAHELLEGMAGRLQVLDSREWRQLSGAMERWRSESLAAAQVARLAQRPTAAPTVEPASDLAGAATPVLDPVSSPLEAVRIVEVTETPTDEPKGAVEREPSTDAAGAADLGEPATTRDDDATLYPFASPAPEPATPPMDDAGAEVTDEGHDLHIVVNQNGAEPASG